MEVPEFRSGNLGTLAAILAERGDNSKGAVDLLGKVVAAAQKIPLSSSRWNLFCNAAVARAKLGDKEGAASLLRKDEVFRLPAALFSSRFPSHSSIDHAYFYFHNEGDQHYDRLFDASLAADDLSGAVRAGLRVSTTAGRTRNLRRVIGALLDRGMLDLATETADNISAPYGAWLAYRDIERALREAGKESEADEFAEALAATGFSAAIEEGIESLLAIHAKRAAEEEAAKDKPREELEKAKPYRAADEIAAWTKLAAEIKSQAGNNSANSKAPFDVKLFVQEVQKLEAGSMIGELRYGVRNIQNRGREIEGTVAEWERRKAELTSLQ